MVLKQISYITQSLILSVFYAFRDPIKLSKLELVKKEDAYQKAVDSLSASKAGIDEIRYEVEGYENKVKVIEERVTNIKANKNKSEEERKRDVEELLIEKYALVNNIDELKKSVEFGDKSSIDALEKIKDLEIDIKNHKLAIRALELKKQANEARGLLVNTLFQKQIGNGNLEDAEKEVRREGYFIENKENVIKRLAVGNDYKNDIRQRVQEEIEGMEFN